MPIYQQPTTPYQPPPSSPTPPTYTPGFTQQEVKSISFVAWLKLAYIVGFISTFLGLTIFLTKKTMATTTPQVKGEILLEVKYQPVLWKDFGQVFEPLIKVPIFYPDKGFEPQEFLLDSGAIVSSLPREKANQLGFSLAQLPRSTFGGFGGTTSFAYRGNLKLKLGNQETTIPVVFTEAAGTKAILGRSGFFENYSIYFNSKAEKIEIRK